MFLSSEGDLLLTLSSPNNFQMGNLHQYMYVYVHVMMWSIFIRTCEHFWRWISVFQFQYPSHKYCHPYYCQNTALRGKEGKGEGRKGEREREREEGRKREGIGKERSGWRYSGVSSPYLVCRGLSWLTCAVCTWNPIILYTHLLGWRMLCWFSLFHQHSTHPPTPRWWPWTCWTVRTLRSYRGFQVVACTHRLAANSKCATLRSYIFDRDFQIQTRVVHLLFAATWLVHRPVSVHMCDMLNSELDNQPENLCTIATL